MKEDVTLWKFRQVINKTWRNRDGAKGMRVSFYLGNKKLELEHIGQFQIMPDVTIYLKDPEVKS